MKRALLILLLLAIPALVLMGLDLVRRADDREVRRVFWIDGPPANGHAECEVPRGCWVPATGQNLPEETMTRGELRARVNRLKPLKKPLYVLMPTPEEYRRKCAATIYLNCPKLTVVN